MKINILHLKKGAKQATGCAVVIDVFCAYTVEAILANNGAKKIIPIADVKKAYALKKQDETLVLLGERHGEILPGFDFANSPKQIENVDFSGKTIIHTTSAGTQGVECTTNAIEVLTGSLINAKAIANYIKNRGFEEVSLVCMGFETRKKTSEDTLCAKYIKDLLEGGDTSYIEDEIEKLKTTSEIDFFDPNNQGIFPEEDFYLCTRLNKFNFVLKVVRDKNGDYVEKIDL